MAFTVAIDDRNKTTNAYLVAARVSGIPHSFLVGKDGRIIWHGSPLDPELLDIVPNILSGKYDIDGCDTGTQIANGHLSAFPGHLHGLSAR